MTFFAKGRLVKRASSIRAGTNGALGLVGARLELADAAKLGIARVNSARTSIVAVQSA